MFYIMLSIWELAGEKPVALGKVQMANLRLMGEESVSADHAKVKIAALVNLAAPECKF